MRYSVIAGVVVDKTVYRFDKPFDYAVPPELREVCRPGCRVTVPFGRANVRRQGLVLTVTDREKPAEKEIKNILSVVDPEPLLNPELLGLVGWLKDHTFCTYFDAVKTLLPFGLNLKIVPALRLCGDAPCEVLAGLSPEAGAVVAFLRKKGGIAEKAAAARAVGLLEDAPCFDELLQKGVAVPEDFARQNMRDPTVNTVRLISPDTESPTGLTAKQREVFDLLLQAGAATVKEITYFTGVTAAVVRALEKKKLVSVYPAPVMRPPAEESSGRPEKIVLTDEQSNAYESLCRDLESDEAKTSLLYGVTGSGKTSVFLKLVDRAVELEKSVIVMVPEISLTPQTLSKFRTRYGDRVAVFHSAMSLGQRMEEWKRAASHQAVVAIGTRSAVFAPLENIGLIIMDEEQEHTYKSEQSPRYHAREVARVRCHYHKALLLLASATPSVESYSLAKSGKYGLVTLRNRYGNAVLPEVLTVDMRSELAAGNTGILSRRLNEELRLTLEQKKQAILLLNRRGHNTYVSCPACGHVMTCPNCSISLTYHSANHRLMCHYCGRSEPAVSECPSCKNKKLRFSGAGTQRADEEIAAIFPNARILRMDADTTMSRDAFEKGLSAFAAGEYDIMLGTQMVAKGLDFPNVTLVGVLSADQSMYSDDYRAFERTFSLLTQVIGRSGRGDSPGLAVVQTCEPQSEVISLACQQDYDGFYETEIMTRRLMIYPPYCDIVMLGITAADSQTAKSAADRLFELIKQGLEADGGVIKMIILGPSPASVPRVNSKYRQRILLKTKNIPRFRAFLHEILMKFYESAGRNVSVFADINPESII